MSQATRFVRSSLQRNRADRAARTPRPAPRVLIFGGSQGAHAINMAMVEAAPRLAAAGGVAITHQTGERDLELVRRAYRDAGLEARVEPFLYAMDREMKDADVIVCRAGATTIAELTAAGRAAILIPLPTAADDHQRKNAEVLRRAGAAELIEQKDLTGDRARRARARARRRSAHGEPAMSRGSQAVREARRRQSDRRSRAGARRRRLMLGRTRRIHFVGVGGHRHERDRRAAREPRIRGQRIGREDIGRDRSAGHAGRPDRARARRLARRQRRRRRGLVGDTAGEPGGRRGAAARDSGDPASRDARRADAAAIRDRDRGRARQDDDDVDGGAGARARRPGSDRGHRRTVERVRQQRPAGPRRLHGGRGGRERSIVSEADARRSR